MPEIPLTRDSLLSQRRVGPGRQNLPLIGALGMGAGAREDQGGAFREINSELERERKRERGCGEYGATMVGRGEA